MKDRRESALVSRALIQSWFRDWSERGFDFMGSEIDRQTGRVIPWFVVSFVAGVALFFSWAADPSLAIGPVMLFLGSGLFLVGRQKRGLQFISVAVFALGLGHMAAQARTWAVAAPVLERELGPMMISGTVTQADKRPQGNRIVIEDFVLSRLSPEQTPKRLRLTIPASHGLPAVGSRIVVRVVVRPAGLPVVPDGFQFQRFLYFNSIGGTGYSLGQWHSEDANSEPDRWEVFRSWTEQVRRTVGDRIVEIVPGADGTVAAALINGEQSAIPQYLQEAYRVSGIAHLLSISGVHMSLLAGIVFFLVRRLLALTPIAARTDTKKLAAWAGLAITGFYLLISGMSIPAVRSFLMVSVVLTAILLDRTALSLRTLALAALLLAALFPEAVFGASFQMSFLAVLSLVALYEQAWLKVRWRGVDGKFTLLRTVGLYVAALVVTDFVAGGATALFAAYHFNRLPTYSLFANLLAVPITGAWIMPSGLAGLMLMPLGLERLPFEIMGIGVTLIDNIARAVAAWPGSQIHVPPMSTGVMAFAALGGVFMGLWNGRLRWLGVVPVLIAVFQPMHTKPPDLIVDESARVFAVADHDGRLVFKPGRSGRFVREVWRDRFGLSQGTWPASGSEIAALGLSCDVDGCVFQRGGQRILIAFNANAIAEDCGTVDVIVSSLAVYDLCRLGEIYDIIDFSRRGSHAFWFRDGNTRVRSSADSVGDRIWTQ